MATHSRRDYFIVFVALFILTVLEIWVTYLKIDRRVMVATLISMALTKAACVALFYMHLKTEKRSLLYLALTPIPLAGFYAVFLILDSHNILRGALP